MNISKWKKVEADKTSYLRKQFSYAERLRVAGRQKWSCPCTECGGEKLLPKVFHLDHIIPLFEGGSNDLSNVQAICPNGHCLKSSIERSRYFRRQRDYRRGKDVIGYRTVRFIKPEHIHYIDRVIHLLNRGYLDNQNIPDELNVQSRYFADRNKFLTD